MILNSSGPSPLLVSLEHQDETCASAFSILREAVGQRAFPAASLAVTHQGRLIALKAFGAFVYEGDSADAPTLAHSSRQELPLSEHRESTGWGFDADVTPATLFDLASLTKVIATTTMAAILYERGLLELDAPVAGIVPEVLADSGSELDPRRRDVTFRMLLAHASGLPAYEKLFLKAHTRDDVLRAAFTVPLSAAPNIRAEYSDIGFIILGAALERIAQESLAIFSQREIFGPLAMANTTFTPPKELRPKIPPTADDRTFRHKIVQGEVQDENAFILGGVAGHAGLFSTAEDLARFAHAILTCGSGALAREMPVPEARPGASQQSHSAIRPILRAETVALFTRRQAAPTGTSRALGWDTPSTPSQSGKYFGPNSYGHLGYTGTSLWIDADRQLSITLLTNRTWPDCSHQAIKRVRPKVHDAIIDSLAKQE